jgi:Calx-beta domain
VGASLTGADPIPNGKDGLAVDQTGATVGGAAEAANTVAFNLGQGIRVRNVNAVIAANWVFSNGGLGIDHDPAGGQHGHAHGDRHRGLGVGSSVEFATQDVTAKAGRDYAATVGTLTFSPGQSTKAITVEILSDKASEGDESFTVRLTHATHATLGKSATATVIIPGNHVPDSNLAPCPATQGPATCTASTAPPPIPTAICAPSRCRSSPTERSTATV